MWIGGWISEKVREFLLTCSLTSGCVSKFCFYCSNSHFLRFFTTSLHSFSVNEIKPPRNLITLILLVLTLDISTSTFQYNKLVYSTANPQ